MYAKHTRKSKSIADADTELSFDLPDSDYISHLILTLRGTAGALAAGAEPNFKSLLTKIKVEMDGNLIKSLTPEQARALATYDLGVAPVDVFRRSSTIARYSIPILFGRYLWDREVILPAKLSEDDLHLEASIDDIIDTDTFATGTVNADLDIFEYKGLADDPLSKYILRSREVKTWTTAASATEETDLPRGQLYRRAMVMCEEAAIEAGVDITDLKWSMNNDEVTYIDSKWNNIRDINHIDYGLPVIHGREHYGSDADTLEMDLDTIQAVVGNAVTDFKTLNMVTVAGDTVTLGMGDSATPSADTSDDVVYMLAYGYGYDHSVMLDIMRNNEIPTCYDSRGKSNCTITATDAGADGAASITLEELMKAR